MPYSIQFSLMFIFFFFFFNDPAPTEIYTLSLHDALPIWHQLIEKPKPLLRKRKLRLALAQTPSDRARRSLVVVNFSAQILLQQGALGFRDVNRPRLRRDRKSTRLNSRSHLNLVSRLLLEK